MKRNNNSNYGRSNISNQFDAPGRAGLHPHVMRSTPDIESRQDRKAYENRSDLVKIMNGNLNPNLSDANNNKKGFIDNVIDYAVRNPVVTLLGLYVAGMAISKIGKDDDGEKEFETIETRSINSESQAKPQIVIINGATPGSDIYSKIVSPAEEKIGKDREGAINKDTQMDCDAKKQRRKQNISLEERIRRSKLAKKQKRKKDGTFAKGKTSSK